MRILEISPYNFAAGGSDRYFLELSRLLEGKGHEVFRFCKRDERNVPYEFDSFFPVGINTSRPGLGDGLRLLYNVDASQKLDAFLTENPVDIAHLHIYYGHFSGSIFKVLRKHKVPMVQTMHDYKAICPVYSCNRHGAICEDCEGRKFWKAFTNRCNRGSLSRSTLSTVEAYVTDYLGARSAFELYIAVAHFQAERLKANGVPADKLRVLHNFVDQARYPLVPEDKPANKILYFGRVEESKGIETLLDAFLAVPKEQRGDVELIFAGTGNGLEMLEAKIAEAGDPSVKSLGYVAGQDLFDLIHSSICTVLVPNVYENCSMSVLESQAMGVPVIGGKIAAVPELIVHDEDGLLVPSGDVYALRDALARMISDRGAARAMGLAAAKKIARDFGPEGHVTELAEIFETVIAEYKASA